MSYENLYLEKFAIRASVRAADKDRVDLDLLLSANFPT